MYFTETLNPAVLHQARMSPERYVKRRHLIPDFRVEGHDLLHEHELKPWVAALGGEVRVPTLEGHAKLKIPAATQNGQRFRLKQRGLPQAGNSATRGDLYVVIGIDIPETVTPEQRKAWEKLAELG
jgi:DnaJ-class molecular chaperone